jgi:hypothetical protein
MWKKKRMARQAKISQEEVMGLCSKTKFVRKEQAELLNPRDSKKMNKRRASKLASKYLRSSKQFPKLRKIQMSSKTRLSSRNPQR